MDNVGIHHEGSRVVVEFNEGKAPVVACMMPLHPVDNRNYRTCLRDTEHRFRFTPSTEAEHAHPVMTTFIENSIDPSDFADNVRFNNL